MEQRDLLREDITWCIQRFPSGLRTLLKSETSNLVVAGGFIRSCVANEKISDIDLFSTSKEQAELYARRYAGDKGRVIATDNAFTVVEKAQIPVQFIHRWVYEKPQDILASFDFTIAMAAIWFDGIWNGICADRFYTDLAAKRLVYTSPKRIEEVGGSLLRVLKFYQRGYRIPLDSFGQVIARLVSGIQENRLGIENRGNVEEWTGKVLTGLMREVDPLVDLGDGAYFPASDIVETEPETDELNL